MQISKLQEELAASDQPRSRRKKARSFRQRLYRKLEKQLLFYFKKGFSAERIERELRDDVKNFCHTCGVTRNYDEEIVRFLKHRNKEQTGDKH